MTMDSFMMALCAWRENRSGGISGMQSVINVIMNRVNQRKSSAYLEVIRPWQFSSITAKGDPELTLYPGLTDPQWLLASSMANDALQGQLADITEGATFYYALTIAPPNWAASMVPTVIIGGQQFMKEAS